MFLFQEVCPGYIDRINEVDMDLQGAIALQRLMFAQHMQRNDRPTGKRWITYHDSTMELFPSSH